MLWGLPAALLARHAGALAPAPLVFPRDHGAHPDTRIEWWYITGRLEAAGREFGFQVTFFRTRVDRTQDMQSRFAARQLVFAHAAVTDVQGRRLLHDQRIAREGFEVASAATGDTRLRLRDWSLARADSGVYWTRVESDEFSLDLRFTPTQPMVLQGRAGWSRKGPAPQQASFYYSQPQLAAAGTLSLSGRRFEAAGKAWLDHEWSDELLNPNAVGWDWIGMNLHDGSALTAFRLRRADGSALWDGGSFRSANGRLSTFDPGTVQFTPQRRWTSTLSRAEYPVEWSVRTLAGTYRVAAVLDDQELDSRASTGAIYWEGLSRLSDAQGRTVGAGYLEMTGYAQRLRL
ncbi:hydrolase [Ramlibacter tataouinensis]|uniref:Hydrolase n=1 Tax=Ramlibacter tataouinensis TaxID=94132 RepID=A0A127JZ61_9BURK|nr:hydrolase [Ramlibacter tataouinensis]